MENPPHRPQILSNQSFLQTLDINEEVLLIQKVWKYNSKNKLQERLFIITTKAIYNIYQNFANKLMPALCLIPCFSLVRRRIDITKVVAITISNHGYEFVLHVDSEDDYRLYSAKRSPIIQAINQAYTKEIGDSLLLFYFADEKNLNRYRRTNKGQPLKFSKDCAGFLNEKLLKKRLKALDEGTGIRQEAQTMFNRFDPNENVSVSDFFKLRKLGAGSFGKVYLVRKVSNGRLYAMKSISKEHLNNKGLIGHAEIEKYVLASNESPFLVKLDYSFQTPEKIYFVIDYKQGGDLYERMKKIRRLDEAQAKFYVAETILALEYLHSKEIVYRDLKPENVLIDQDGHICLTDFGTSKYLKDQKVTNTFIGTCDYMAPEIIKCTQNCSYGKSVDWWSLGVFLYELLVGVTPFCSKCNDENRIMDNILTKGVSFPIKSVILSVEVKDLLRKLLEKDPEMRLGAGGVQEIKDHEWFSDIDWNSVAERTMLPPYKPRAEDSNNDISSLESCSLEELEGMKTFRSSRFSSGVKGQGGFQHFNNAVMGMGRKTQDRN